MEQFKKFSWTLYALILVCMIMPFLTISCGNQKATSLTGIQLMTGSTINAGGQVQELKPNIFIGGMFVLTLMGLIVVATGKKDKPGFKSGAVMNMISIVLLILYKINTDNEILRNGQGIISVTYENGYWFALVLSVITLIIMMILESAAKNKQPEINKPEIK